uniref:Uncharacterized protein n=1 Tax=viral metagenome TaxID=1070528 RepID=A0A6M3IEQ9_9ZZZZ
MNTEQPFRFKTEDERNRIIRKYIGNGEIRCSFCGKLFFLGRLGSGSEIAPKCPRCKKENRITVL